MQSSALDEDAHADPPAGQRFAPPGLLRALVGGVAMGTTLALAGTLLSASPASARTLSSTVPSAPGTSAEGPQTPSADAPLSVPGTPVDSRGGPRFSARTVLPARAQTARAPGKVIVSSRGWPGHPDRRLVTHVVRRGDTATGLSVRYHAWTREFIALNGAHLRVGQRVRVPVVISAARKARKARHKHKAGHKHKTSTQKPPRSHKTRGHHASGTSSPRWRHYRLDRTQVRGVITRHARKRGVPVNLALAVAWQESGWRQPLISSAGAIGVMQVLPSTGRWMSLLASKRLNLYDTHANVRAGTMLLQFLRARTRTDRAALAAYYEGLGGIQNGWYDETKRYVRSVMAIKRHLDRTGQPTG